MRVEMWIGQSTGHYMHKREGDWSEAKKER